MTPTLGLRTLLLIAFVVAATAVLMHHGLEAAADPTANAIPMLARN